MKTSKKILVLLSSVFMISLSSCATETCYECTSVGGGCVIDVCDNNVTGNGAGNQTCADAIKLGAPTKSTEGYRDWAENRRVHMYQKITTTKP